MLSAKVNIRLQDASHAVVHHKRSVPRTAVHLRYTSLLETRRDCLQPGKVQYLSLARTRWLFVWFIIYAMVVRRRFVPCVCIYALVRVMDAMLSSERPGSILGGPPGGDLGRGPDWGTARTPPPFQRSCPGRGFGRPGVVFS